MSSNEREKRREDNDQKDKERREEGQEAEIPEGIEEDNVGEEENESDIEVEEPEPLSEKKRKRMKLKTTFHRNESDTVTKVLIVKIRTKIKMKENRDEIYVDMVQVIQSEVALWLDNWGAEREDPGKEPEILLTDIEKRFIQKTTKTEAMERMEDIKQLENETFEY